MNEERKPLLDVIRRRYDDIKHTHKTHEKERERASRRVRLEKWIRIILTFIAALTIGAEAARLQSSGAIIATIVSAISFLYSLYRLSTSPESRVYSHTIAAKQFKAERDNLEKLIEEHMSEEFSCAEIREKLASIDLRINSMEPLIPYTNGKAYREAVKALSSGGEGVSTRSEIDRQLPEGLRLADKEDKSSEELQTAHKKDSSSVSGLA